MSSRDLASLRERVWSNPQIARALRAATPENAVETILRVARDLGMNVTRDDLQAAILEHRTQWMQRWLTQSLRPWLPAFTRTHGEPSVEWLMLDERLHEPFFEQSLGNALAYPANAIFARRSPLAARRTPLEALEDAASGERAMEPAASSFTCRAAARRSSRARSRSVRRV